MSTMMKSFARGTLAALERQANGQVVTSAQQRASLEQENLILRQRLVEARELIQDLQQQLDDAIAQRPPAPRLISQSEAAKALNVHPSTISRWASAGHLELHHVPGRAVPLIDANTLRRPPRKRRTL